MCESDQCWYMASTIINPLRRYRVCLANSKFHAMEKMGISEQGWKLTPMSRRGLSELLNGNGVQIENTTTPVDDPLEVKTQNRTVIIHG